MVGILGSIYVNILSYPVNFYINRLNLAPPGTVGSILSILVFVFVYGGTDTAALFWFIHAVRTLWEKPRTVFYIIPLVWIIIMSITTIIGILDIPYYFNSFYTTLQFIREFAWVIVGALLTIAYLISIRKSEEMNIKSPLIIWLIISISILSRGLINVINMLIAINPDFVDNVQTVNAYFLLIPVLLIAAFRPESLLATNTQIIRANKLYGIIQSEVQKVPRYPGISRIVDYLKDIPPSVFDALESEKP